MGPSSPLSSCVPGLLCLLSAHISSLINGTGDNTYLRGLFWEVTELKYAKHFKWYWHIHIQQMCLIIIFSLLYYSLSDHVGWPKSVIHKYKKKNLISPTLKTLNGQDQCLPKALTGYLLLHQLPTSVPIRVLNDQCFSSSTSVWSHLSSTIDSLNCIYQIPTTCWALFDIRNIKIRKLEALSFKTY